MKYAVIYQDKHCYNALRLEGFKTKKEMLEFVADEECLLCPEGEKMDYVIVYPGGKLERFELNRT